jgi:hypothetical protein
LRLSHRETPSQQVRTDGVLLDHSRIVAASNAARLGGECTTRLTVLVQ